MTPFILLLVLLIMTNLRGFKAKDSFSQYWEEHIGLSDPPHWLAAKASPLTFHEVATFMKLIDEDELASHLHSFCVQANVACSINALVNKATDNATLPPIAQWNAFKVEYEKVPKETPLSVVRQGGLPYFRESMVKEGGFILIPDLRDPISHKSFLPRALTTKVPFSISRIEELKKLFGVMDDSIMNKHIQDTLETCENSPFVGHKSTCVVSAEDLIDFIVANLGPRVSTWSTKSIEGSYENVTIGAMKLIHADFSEPPALCHSMPFLYQVYYCHILQKVKIYTVDIHAQKKVNQAIMACHYDTSSWNPHHIAFKLLGFHPGLIEVCHWITENGIVWIKRLEA